MIRQHITTLIEQRTRKNEQRKRNYNRNILEIPPVNPASFTTNQRYIGRKALSNSSGNTVNVTRKADRTTKRSDEILPFSYLILYSKSTPTRNNLYHVINVSPSRLLQDVINNRHR